MACENITKGRKVLCKNGFSGIQAVSFLPYANALTLDSSDLWQGGGLTGSFYKYDVKNDGVTYEEDGASDRATGTIVYTGTLNVVLPGLDKATRDELKLMAYGRPQIVLELYNGDKVLIGAEYGCELTSHKSATGGARKDMAGYTLNFVTEERRPLVWLGATGSTVYTAAISSNYIS